MQKDTILTNHLLLQLVVLIWGLTGIIGKASPLEAESLASGRMLVAFIAIALIRLPSLRKAFQTKSKADLSNLMRHDYLKWSVIVPLLIGPVIALHWFTFFGAIKASNVSTALSCLATAGVFTSLIEPFVLRTKINKTSLLFSLLSLLGVSIIYRENLMVSSGIVLAIISAILASIFTTFNGLCVKKKAAATTVTLWEMLSGYLFISLLFQINPADSLSLSDHKGMISVFTLGVLCTAIPFIISVYVMRKLSPSTVAISVNLEQLYSIIIAVLIWKETEVMSKTFYLGAFLIAASSILNAIFQSKRKNSMNGNLVSETVE